MTVIHNIVNVYNAMVHGTLRPFTIYTKDFSIDQSCLKHDANNTTHYLMC